MEYYGDSMGSGGYLLGDRLNFYGECGNIWCYSEIKTFKNYIHFRIYIRKIISNLIRSIVLYRRRVCSQNTIFYCLVEAEFVLKIPF